MAAHFRPSTSRGAAAVEFAIVLPLLMLVLFGTIEWGRYFYVREAVVHAAREGARAATILDGTPTKACAAASTFLNGIAGPATCTPQNRTINATLPDGTTQAVPGVEVTLTLNFASLTGLPLAIPPSINAVAVMPK